LSIAELLYYQCLPGKKNEEKTGSARVRTVRKRKGNRKEEWELVRDLATPEGRKAELT